MLLSYLFLRERGRGKERGRKVGQTSMSFFCFQVRWPDLGCGKKKKDGSIGACVYWKLLLRRPRSTWTSGSLRASRDTKCLSANKHMVQSHTCTQQTHKSYTHTQATHTHTHTHTHKDTYTHAPPISHYYHGKSRHAWHYVQPTHTSFSSLIHVILCNEVTFASAVKQQDGQVFMLLVYSWKKIMSVSLEFESSRQLTQGRHEKGWKEKGLSP
jgi:hypothetical protein